MKSHQTITREVIYYSIIGNTTGNYKCIDDISNQTESILMIAYPDTDKCLFQTSFCEEGIYGDLLFGKLKQTKKSVESALFKSFL